METVSESVSSRISPARWSRSHGHARELERVGDLVERDPAHQLLAVGVEGADRVVEVRLDEQQPRSRVGVEQHDLVLAEHALGEEADDHADLGGQQQPGDRCERARAPARGWRRRGR